MGIGIGDRVATATARHLVSVRELVVKLGERAVQLGPLGRHVGRARVAARCVSSSQSGVRKTKGARRVAAAAVFCAPLFSLVEL